MKRRTFLASPLLLLASCGRSKAPAGQPPLTRLTEQTLPALRERFNRDAASTRIIAMLSPT